MQAIVEWLKGLLETLKSLSYERLFVGSVVVATLAGSLYVYLVDDHDAPVPDQAGAFDLLVSERLAPIGRLTLAEPVVAPPTMDPVAAGGAVSASPDEAQRAPIEADGAAPVVAEPLAPSADRPMTGAAAIAEPLGQVQAYPPVPPGFMPMPAPGYAPAYPPYQAPPAAVRQAPGAPFGYAPGPYRVYSPTLYERSVAPPGGYPPPQGWVR